MNKRIALALILSLGSAFHFCWAQSPDVMRTRFSDKEIEEFAEYATQQFHKSIYEAVKSGELTLYADAKSTQKLSPEDGVRVLSQKEYVQVINPLTPDDPFNLVDAALYLPTKAGNWWNLYVHGDRLVLNLERKKTAVMDWKDIPGVYVSLMRSVLPKSEMKKFDQEKVKQAIFEHYNRYKKALFQLAEKNISQAKKTAVLQENLSKEEQSGYLKRVDKLKVPFVDEFVPNGHDTIIQHPRDEKHFTQLVFINTYSLGATTEIQSFSFGLGIDYLWEITPGEPTMMNRVTGWLPYHLIPDNLTPEHLTIHDAIYQYSMIKSLGLLEKD